MKCPVPDQDLSGVWGLVLLFVGIILGRWVANFEAKRDEDD